jgi:hypothetical protein
LRSRAAEVHIQTDGKRIGFVAAANAVRHGEVRIRGDGKPV